MSQKTNIEWADSTVSPTTGCQGCELWKVGVGGPCYAGNLHEGRLAKSLPLLYAPTFDEVRLAPGRMTKAAAWSDLRGKTRPDKPWLDGLPRLIFVSDLGDLFSKDVPFDYIRSELIDVATGVKGRRHIWMILTKLPTRMLAFAEWLNSQSVSWPDNVWAGASVTSSKTLKRVDYLLKVPAKVRYLSIEPQLGDVDLTPYLFCERCNNPSVQCGLGAYMTPLDNAAGGCWFRECGCCGIDLVIQGGESGQGKHQARPFDIAWARSTRDHCKDAGVSYFLKQFGSNPYDSSRRISIDGPGSHAVELSLKDHHGGNWGEWEEGLRVRQMPAVAAPPG